MAEKSINTACGRDSDDEDKEGRRLQNLDSMPVVLSDIGALHYSESVAETRHLKIENTP